MTRANIIRLFLMLILVGCINDLLAQQNKEVKNKSTVAFSDEETICARVYVNPYPTNNLQFLDNWANGTIWFAGGKQATGQLLRYNSWLDELAWLSPADYTVGLVLKEKVVRFAIDATESQPARQFVKTTIDELGGLQQKEVFLELLSDGNIRLYCHHKTLVTRHTGTMKVREIFYLTIDGKLIRFKPGKRAVLNLLDNNLQEKLKAAIKTEHLHLRKTADLKHAIDLLNQ